MFKQSMLRAGILVACACLTLATESVAAEQNGSPAVHLRGTVVSYDGKILKMKSREGQFVDVALAEGWKISSVANASLESVKPGDFVGIASLPKAGGDHALEVLIFPPALKGAGEGSYGWDLKPHSSMTNASVTNLVKGVNGRTVTLSYNGGQQKTITIPQGTPVVTIAPATPDDLKPGAPVFVAADPGSVDKGKASTHQVVVGKDGVVPPM